MKNHTEKGEIGKVFEFYSFHCMPVMLEYIYIYIYLGVTCTRLNKTKICSKYVGSSEAKIYKTNVEASHHVTSSIIMVDSVRVFHEKMFDQ